MQSVVVLASCADEVLTRRVTTHTDACTGKIEHLILVRLLIFLFSKRLYWYCSSQIYCYPGTHPQIVIFHFLQAQKRLPSQPRNEQQIYIQTCKCPSRKYLALQDNKLPPHIPHLLLTASLVFCHQLCPPSSSAFRRQDRIHRIGYRSVDLPTATPRISESIQRRIDVRVGMAVR